MNRNAVLENASIDNLESDGLLWVYDLTTGLEVASYEGVTVHRALILARYIVDCSFAQIHVKSLCDPDVIVEAKAVFDEVFSHNTYSSRKLQHSAIINAAIKRGLDE